jgi:prepilin-type N-terminal cleavage/methylation domain-containing protein/prepilin-type processing-associated H-X9-DG protein
MFMQARRGYTLVEVMVAVAVLAVCASLIMPSLDRMKAKAQRSACVSHLRQIGTASLTYHADRGTILPWYTNADGYWWNALTPYLGADRKIFHCPADKAYREFALDSTISYGWNYKLTGHGDSGANPNDFVRIATYSRPGQVPIATDGPGGPVAGQEDSWGYIDERAVHTADPKRHEGQGNTLYLDGHVEALRTEDLPNSPFFNDRPLQQQ